MGASYPFSFKNKSIGGKIFRFNMFRAVLVPMSGVKTPERRWNPVTPAMNCRAKHNPALKRRAGMSSHKKGGTQHPCFAPPMYGKIYKYSYSSMLQFSAAKRL